MRHAREVARQARRLCMLIALSLTVGLPTTLIAQVAASDGASGIRLYTDELGDYTWPVTTDSPEAQAYFDQGVKLMYAFDPAKATLSFEAARDIDPECAMCWWGEAWSLGPYLNGGMVDSDAQQAFDAATRARSLARTNATPVERAMTEAMVKRYVPEHPPEGRRQFDEAYAAAMADVYAEFSDLPNVATIYAASLMILEPRRGVWSATKPSVAHIHEVLEGALAIDLSHPGACHLYVHATESNSKVLDAQACADLLGNSMPGASHINHMPSHTYNQVGRWGDAVRANIEAWHSDQKAAIDEGFAIYPNHNLQMLLFAASNDGQSGIANQAANDYRKLAQENGGSFQAMTRVRFGRFDEVLQLQTAPEHPIHLGLWAFSRGYAHLRTGQADSARVYLALVDSLARDTPSTARYRVHEPAQLLGIVGGILRGALLRDSGRPAEAIDALQQALTIENGLVYDEPEPLPFMVEDWLGKVLLEQGRAADAERVYRDALVKRPHNGWSLIGLEQALRAQGRDDEADRTGAEFDEAWARSDTWITSSAF